MISQKVKDGLKGEAQSLEDNATTFYRITDLRKFYVVCLFTFALIITLVILLIGIFTKEPSITFFDSILPILIIWASLTLYAILSYWSMSRFLALFSMPTIFYLSVRAAQELERHNLYKASLCVSNLLVALRYLTRMAPVQVDSWVSSLDSTLPSELFLINQKRLFRNLQDLTTDTNEFVESLYTFAQSLSVHVSRVSQLPSLKRVADPQQTVWGLHPLAVRLLTSWSSINPRRYIFSKDPSMSDKDYEDMLQTESMGIWNFVLWLSNQSGFYEASERTYFERHSTTKRVLEITTLMVPVIVSVIIAIIK